MTVDNSETIIDDEVPPGMWDAEHDRWDLPRDLVEADWHARKLRWAHERLEEIKMVAAREVAAIETWAQRQSARYDERIVRHEDALRRWHDGRLAQDAKAKTVEFPSGVIIRSRSGRISIVVDDEQALARWADQHDPSLVSREVRIKVDRASVVAKYGAKAGKEAGKWPAFDPDTGEILPGVLLKRGEPAWSVEMPRTEMVDD